jgi:hypothetical protein
MPVVRTDVSSCQTKNLQIWCTVLNIEFRRLQKHCWKPLDQRCHYHKNLKAQTDISTKRSAQKPTNWVISQDMPETMRVVAVKHVSFRCTTGVQQAFNMLNTLLNRNWKSVFGQITAASCVLSPGVDGTTIEGYWRRITSTNLKNRSFGSSWRSVSGNTRANNESTLAQWSPLSAHVRKMEVSRAQVLVTHSTSIGAGRVSFGVSNWLVGHSFNKRSTACWTVCCTKFAFPIFVVKLCYSINNAYTIRKLIQFLTELYF